MGLQGAAVPALYCGAQGQAAPALEKAHIHLEGRELFCQRSLLLGRPLLAERAKASILCQGPNSGPMSSGNVSLSLTFVPVERQTRSPLSSLGCCSHCPFYRKCAPRLTREQPESRPLHPHFHLSLLSGTTLSHWEPVL